MPPPTSLPLALLWLRRDLRLADNPALAAALRRGVVLPVYIHAPEEEQPWAPGAASRWWLHHSLQALDAELRQRGSRLLIRQGNSLRTLQTLIHETGATAVYWNRLYEPAVIRRDAHIKQALRAESIDAQSFNAALWFEPWEVQNAAGEPYKVFTPFWKKAIQPRLNQLPSATAVPAQLPLTPCPDSLSLEALKLRPALDWDQGFRPLWQPGEAGAWAALEALTGERLAAYPGERDLPGRAATSRLSPHLHFGEISPAQIYRHLQARLSVEPQAGAVAGADKFLSEVAWREFAHHLLYHFPHTPDAPLDTRFAALPWREPDRATLRRWQRGQTGIPLVDAGMRELWTTGWMHNRVRMVVASFLTKNLLIDWREGAHWFWDTLVDASLANNTLGWQWTAGCGADAAPYFRVFNPELQAAKFDASEAYLRRWLPELGTSRYPIPMVDLKASRERALAAYASLKSSARASQ